ncbi:19966_t:CDS:2 [Funneliformis geosporum]|uniref:19966_t:CDS:1 n=1 Tax=Funneliformis geosporum TaxID=1117311 RepID=A0A9W4WSB0_9GLOM|nr:19966_t:CDS:2 [Funneliformis geosporum]
MTVDDAARQHKKPNGNRELAYKCFEARRLGVQKDLKEAALYCQVVGMFNAATLYITGVTGEKIQNLIQLLTRFDKFNWWVRVLEHFTLELEDGWPRLDHEFLKEFANDLPSSLNYLGLNFSIIPDQLSFFLRECANVPLHTFELMHFHRDDLDYLMVVVGHFKEF